MSAVKLTPVDMRLMLRKEICSDGKYVNILLKHMKEYFECTNITFNHDEMRIDIKIKKTVMKKADDYSHDIVYYYPLISQAMLSFLNDDIIYNSLSTKGLFGDALYNGLKTNVLSLFSATVLLDNMIIINL